MNWYLVMDSKSKEVTINCENIEDISVNQEDQVVITYYLPEGKSPKASEKEKFIRKQDLLECCENNLIIKTYQGIRKQIVEVLGGEE